MKQLLGQMVLLSAYQSDKPLGVNMLAQVDLVKILSRAGVHFTSATGCYMGGLEESVAVMISDKSLVYWLLELAAKFGQECILLRYTDGSCYLLNCKDADLYYTRPIETYIGQWTNVSETRAMSLVGYTKKGNSFFAAI